jgi:hypothetical protein
MVHGHSHVEVEVRVHAQDHLDPGVRPFGADHLHTSKTPFNVAVTFHPRSRRERTNVL